MYVREFESQNILPLKAIGDVGGIKMYEGIMSKFSWTEMIQSDEFIDVEYEYVSQRNEVGSIRVLCR